MMSDGGGTNAKDKSGEKEGQLEKLKKERSWYTGDNAE